MACGEGQGGAKRDYGMTRLTWWQRTAALRNHPLVLTILICGVGLAIIAYYLAKYGFSNTILRRQLLIGLCAGLVFNLYYIWRYRRNLRGYIDQELGLGLAESGGGMMLVPSCVSSWHRIWPNSCSRVAFSSATDLRN